MTAIPVTFLAWPPPAPQSCWSPLHGLVGMQSQCSLAGPMVGAGRPAVQ